ncbi:hypothetical protein [Lacinutrix sp.]|uniref:hypothetical protein n=1 Tax=Lacinutrix sp. TaxID=1937692 RepID=UPI0025BBC028|nr:hypothetical protein [Lacinutrix sp.]
MIEERKFTIQGINNLNQKSILPLGLHTATYVINTILIHALENVPEELEIVLFDKEASVYHKILKIMLVLL